MTYDVNIALCVTIVKHRVILLLVGLQPRHIRGMFGQKDGKRVCVGNLQDNQE